MRKKLTCAVALCLSLCLLLTGCVGLNFRGYFQHLATLLGGSSLMPFDQMEYTRPDMTNFETVTQRCCTDAGKETDLEKMVQIIYDFYGVYDDFYTSYALAMIHYSKDQTDSSWQEEYNFCTANAAQADAALDRFYRVLAKSSLRGQLEGDDYFGAGFFDRHRGESVYDEVFTELLNQEAQLENQYYDLMAQAGENFAYTDQFYETYGAQMAEIFVQLIENRQAQAKHAGYDSYPEFAYDFYYVRDYSLEQTTSYLADIRAELSPLYRSVVQDLDVKLYRCTEEQTLAYVKNMALTMGGQIASAFTDMEKAELFDITFSENKLNSSYEIYLRNYRTPYVFLNPSGTEYDMLTFAHEFGHFCNDYLSMGSGVSVDVSEVFSQGMEYLSLCYGSPDENLAKLKMVDSLCIFVEQAAYASFEQQVYGLTGDALTVENVEALYTSVCTGFGLEGGWRYVMTPHFFTEPMYVISYVVSNDAALQMYQMEKAKSGTGLACLVDNMTTMEPYFLAFVKEAGLKSPFTPGRIQEVKETLESVLKG